MGLAVLEDNFGLGRAESNFQNLRVAGLIVSSGETVATLFHFNISSRERVNKNARVSSVGLA